MPQRAQQLNANADNATLAAGVTRFAAYNGRLGGAVGTLLTAENQTQVRIRNIAIVENLLVRVDTNSTSSASTVRTRVGGANGNLSVSIGAGASGEFEDSPGTPDNLVDGDQVNYQMINGGGGSLTLTVLGVTFGTFVNMVSMIMVTGSSAITRGSTVFHPVNGTILPQATESERQYTIRFATDLDRLTYFLSSNATGNGGTGRLRVNTADGNNNISYAGGATGEFEDITNTDTLAAADIIDYETDVAGGGMPNDITLQKIQMRMTTAPTNSQISMSSEGGIGTISGLVRFYTIMGTALTAATEAFAQCKIRGGQYNAENLFVRVNANSLDASATIRTRIDGADGNLVVTFTTTLTGIQEDQVNLDLLDPAAEVNYEIDTSAAGAGSITPDIIVIQLQLLENINAKQIRTSMYSSRALGSTRQVPGKVTEPFRSFFVKAPGEPAVVVPTININTIFMSTTMYSTYDRSFRRLLPGIVTEPFESFVTMPDILTHVSPNVRTELVLMATTMYSTYARGHRRLMPGVVTEPFRSFRTQVESVTENVRTANVFMATTMYSTYAREHRRLLPGVITEPFVSFRTPVPGEPPPATININTIFMATSMYSTYARGVRRLLPEAVEMFPRTFFTEGPPPAISVSLVFPRMPKIVDIVREPYRTFFTNPPPPAISVFLLLPRMPKILEGMRDRNRTFFIVIPGGAPVVVRVRYLGDGIAITF